MSNPNDPVEDLGDEIVATEGCPCGDHHGRNQYQDTGKRVIVDGAVKHVMRCPNGCEVTQDIDISLPPVGSAAPIFERIETDDLPANARLVRPLTIRIASSLHQSTKGSGDVLPRLPHGDVAHPLRCHVEATAEGGERPSGSVQSA